MGRSLVIVESPAKAKTINKYLGKDFVVKSSYGHVRDLPDGASEGELANTDATASAAIGANGKPAKAVKKPKGKATANERAATKHAALIRRMGVDPEHGWAARYEILPGKEKVVADLRESAEACDLVYLASDLDREGEAIAWHLKEAIGGPESRFRRVVFNEITKTAIQEAFAKPGALNLDRVNAQQARRFLDRVVGYQVSPLLWQKVARGLSAGRVQSVAVRLIVEREREIRAFIPVEYWELHADTRTADRTLRLAVVREAGQAFKPVTRAHIDQALKALEGATYRVASAESKPTRVWPNAPFITSTLQAAASVRLGFSVKRTMSVAQRLYEAGHITYMRTDSTNLSKDAVAACRTLIEKDFGARYLPAEVPVYAAKAGAQEAHEAVRPTDVRVAAADLDVEDDQRRLYELIWRQFVACQMPPAEYDSSTITVQANTFELTARGRVLRFDGFTRVLPPTKSEDTILPPVAVGDVLALDRLDPTQHFTKPPARFSEANLVRELEKRGIGRPSTYASIISTIQDRGYVSLRNRRFYAEKLGDLVTTRLSEAFPDLMDFGFTAAMEGELDRVAEGKEPYRAVLDRFYGGFTAKLAEADEHMRPNPPVPVPGIACATCGKPMTVRVARTGVFLSCSGYALPPKERCTGTMNLVPGDESEAVRTAEGDDESEATEADVGALRAKRRCPLCSTAMDSWLVDERRRLHICGNSPECPGIQIEDGQFKLKGYDGPSVPCDKCGKPMQLKSGRFGKYFGCTGYPDCSNTRKLLRNGQAAPPKAKPIPMPELACEKGGYFVLRDGMLGLFLASNLYPKVRETRNPQVADLVRHREALDPKFIYLAEAPIADDDGNPTVIRFSRKTREHYLISERAGEPSGWSATLVDGKWVGAKNAKDDEAETVGAARGKKKKA